MPEYDPIRDDETKIISITSLCAVDNPGSIDLPDGTKQVPMGSGIITGILGEGGMSIIYEIWNEQLGVKRAVKLQRPNSSDENKVRFEKEMKVTAQLDHPNIIDIHTVGEWRGLPYIEMEMVNGISLGELIGRQGALPLSVCTAIGIIVCRALEYTHHHEYIIDEEVFKGVLHGDLKPGNILFSREGIIRLTDFGVATSTEVSKSTPNGKVVGSMQYLSPEQMEEGEVDTRADIFSFGCIFYEMLTGERTFPERNITKLVRKRLKNEFKPLSSFNISFPPKLVHLIHQCLELNVNKRPKDITNVLKEFEEIHRSITQKNPEEIISTFARGEEVEDVPAIPERHMFSNFNWKITTTALILICIVALSAFLIVTNSSKKETGLQTTKKQTKTEISADKMDVAVHKESPKEILPGAKVAIAHQAEKVEIKKTEVVTGGEGTIIIQETGKRPAGPKMKKTGGLKWKAKKTPKIKRGLKASLKKLFIKYDTNDFMVVLREEDFIKNYTAVLEIYNSLPPDQAGMKASRIYRHRALIATQIVDASYYDNNHVNDGEFYLSKARFLYENKLYQKALWILKSIETTPALLMNKNKLHKEMLFYKARCNTKIFKSNPTLERQKTALQSWFDVKNEFRSNQGSPFFMEANREIREISKESFEQSNHLLKNERSRDVDAK